MTGGHFKPHLSDCLMHDPAYSAAVQGATGWDAPLRVFTPDTGPTGSVTAEAAAPPPPSAAATVPAGPLWLLGVMVGLLSLGGCREVP